MNAFPCMSNGKKTAALDLDPHQEDLTALNGMPSISHHSRPKPATSYKLQS